jgi:hypothetical protein
MALKEQGKLNIGILKKIKEYPEYRNHLPVITSGSDIFTGYIDYYFAEAGGKTAGMLFMLTVMPLPGCMGNHDYMLAIIDPDDITVTFDSSYYGFDPAAVNAAEDAGIGLAAFYRAVMRAAEYGLLHWALPFRRYALRAHGSTYSSGIRALNCGNDTAYSLQGSIFMPGSARPADSGVFTSSYEDLRVFYVPLMYLNAIGGPLGIFPGELLAAFNSLLLQRKLSAIPPPWLSAKERRKSLALPYAFAQTVYDQESRKSYISLIDGNAEPPSNEAAWKEINYARPYNAALLPPSAGNPLEELLALFNKSFDLSRLAP